MWNPFRRSSAGGGRWDHQRPLLSLTKVDPWTIGNALDGLLITGGTGSGKTSTSGRLATTAMLRAGFGGVMLTVKVDDGPQLAAWVRAAGRERDLIVVDGAAPWRINPFDHEMRHGGVGAEQTHNIVSLMMSIIEASDRQALRGGGSGGSDPFWIDANMQTLCSAVDGVKLSGESLSVEHIVDFIESAPATPDEAESPAWKARSFCYRCLKQGEGRPATGSNARDYEKCVAYWVGTYPKLHEKTRQSIVMSVTAAIDIINRGVVHELFGTTTNLRLESAFDGKIILFDLPVKEYGEAGIFAQCLMKRSWQMSVERRRYNATQRPVFLIADEAQFFFNSHDTLFQTTARGSGCATVYITQNVNNCYAAFGGGEVGKAQADSLLGNLSTKVFHANSDVTTNEYAAQLIGKSKQFLFNASTSRSPSTAFSLGAGNNDGQFSSGLSEAWEFCVQPSAFTQLRTGGAPHRRQVDAIVFQNGRRFRSTGATWTPTTFEQPKQS